LHREDLHGGGLPVGGSHLRAVHEARALPLDSRHRLRRGESPETPVAGMPTSAASCDTCTRNVALTAGTAGPKAPLPCSAPPAGSRTHRAPASATPAARR